MQEVESTTGFYFCASRWTGKERDPETNNDDFGEIQDMLARTRANTSAIILGTFHGYKEN